MRGKLSLSFFFSFSLMVESTFSLRQLSSSSGSHCDPTSLPAPQTLRSDQMTVLINGYSESRIPLIHSIASQYSSSPFVASVVILWGNPSTPIKTLTYLSQNLSILSLPSSAPISLIQQSSSSLNTRFLPRPWITTRAVMICDDDVLISDLNSLEFAFKVWTSNRDRLVGFFARSHEIDLSSRTWIYTMHPDKYSILLTKLMIMKVEYLYKYSCEEGTLYTSMANARGVVDEMRNCEDILMNFVAGIEGSGGPILVGADGVRDWGDARNDLEREREVRDVGLSSRRGDHRKRRGDCINEFHRILGRMPLRYSYGKFVHSVGEQGLCEKGGKLVFCDQ